MLIIGITVKSNLVVDFDEDFIKYHLSYLDEAASDIDFLEATLYFHGNDAFLEINYDYRYLGIERRTRYLMKTYWSICTRRL